MKAAFHLSSRTPERYARALNGVETLRDDDAVTLDAVELVADGGGLGLLRADSEFGDRIDALRRRGVVFKGCEHTIERSDLTSEDLLDGVTLVSSGVGELVRLQARGYAYLRA